MRQLIQEGWIHHICRNSLAVFLTRGDLFLGWEKGMQVFFKYLIDVSRKSEDAHHFCFDICCYFDIKFCQTKKADWSVNAGNWNWVSCGDPKDVVKDSSTFCPTRHGKILDPEGTYIRKYVRELEEMPLAYLHEPCRAPLSVQEAAKCVIGKDYPEPCLNHERAYAENIGKLKAFFHAEKREIFQRFLTDKSVLKSANNKEFQTFIYSRFLDDEFEDF